MMMQSAKFTRNWQLLGFAPGRGELPVKSIGMDFSVKTSDSTRGQTGLHANSLGDLQIKYQVITQCL